MKHLLTAENALHTIGIGVTSLAAHTAVSYLQTYSPDYYTALGFSAAISASVFGGWTFTFKSKTLKRAIPLAIASAIVTAISGYTVYQAGLLPLQQAAISAAIEADKPSKATFDTDNARYTATYANLQTSIDDLRKQNATAAADKASTDGKGADWKKHQIQTAIDARTDQINALMEKQTALTKPTEFKPSEPKAIQSAQSAPILARAFAFELIAIMFMTFARFARQDREDQQTAAATDIAKLTEQANASIALLSNAIANLQQTADTIVSTASTTLTTTTTATLEQLAEATTTANHATNHCNNASATITTTTTASLEQLAEATTTATQAANHCNAASTTLTTTTTATLEQLAEATTQATHRHTTAVESTKTRLIETIKQAAEIKTALTTASNAMATGITEATQTTQQLAEAIQAATNTHATLATITEESIAKTTQLSAEIERATALATHLQTAFVPFAPTEGAGTNANAGTNAGTNGANANGEETDPYKVLLYRLKHQLIAARSTGKLPVDHLKEHTAMGRKLIEKAQLEATANGWLIKNSDGSYSYPAKQTADKSNVIQLRSA